MKIKKQKWESKFGIIFFLIFISFIILAVVNNFTINKLIILFIAFSWVPLLIIHETSHALIAHLVDWKVLKISLGFGKTIRKTKVCNVDVDIKQFPVSGYVLPIPNNSTNSYNSFKNQNNKIENSELFLKNIRLKHFLIYLAGPLSELLIALFLILLFGYKTIFTQSESIIITFIQGFTIAAIFGAVFNLIPLSYIDYDNKKDDKDSDNKSSETWSDGLGMLKIWSLPDEYYRNLARIY